VFKSKKEYITWFEEVTKRTTEGFPRSSVTIILKDENKSAVITWNLKDAWASEFNMPDLNAKDNQPAFESIKIKYSSMEVTYA
jgi:phage tail-like protein